MNHLTRSTVIRHYKNNGHRRGASSGAALSTVSVFGVESTSRRPDAPADRRGRRMLVSSISTATVRSLRIAFSAIRLVGPLDVGRHAGVLDFPLA